VKTHVISTFGDSQHTKTEIVRSHNSSCKLPGILRGWAELR